jgi:CHASE2 domain-containing sensor protein
MRDSRDPTTRKTPEPPEVDSTALTPLLPEPARPGDAPLPTMETGSLVGGRYRVISQLGAGGMGAVYLVHHEGLDRNFALKVVKAESSVGPASRKLFEREARVLGLLEHPNILNPTDFGVDERTGVPYLVTELYPGEPVSSLVSRAGPLPMSEAVILFRLVGAALEHAHRAGVLHRDLKPANVMVRRVDGILDVRLMDFGLAKLDTGQRDTLNEGEREPGASPPPPSKPQAEASQLAGTLPYIAPELFKGAPASVSSEVFAMGVFVYEVLTGALPWNRNNRIPTFSVPKAPSTRGLPHELDAPILKAISPDPTERHNSVPAFVKDLETAWKHAAVRLFWQRERPRRAGLSLGLGLVAFALLVAPVLPAVERLERSLRDARFALSTPRRPDPRVLLVELDEASLEEQTAPLASPERGNQLGHMVDGLLDAGATAVALDLLLPQTYQQAPLLQEVVFKRAGSVAIGIFARDGELFGARCLDPLVAEAIRTTRPQAFDRLFALVNVEGDSDSRVRRVRASFSDDKGRTTPTISAFLAKSAGVDLAALSTPIWLESRCDTRAFSRVSWAALPPLLSGQPSRFRNALVLIGATFVGSGDNQHLITAPLSLRSEISGLELHAIQLNTLLLGLPVHLISPRSVSVLLGAAIIPLAFFLLSGGRIAVGAAFLAGAMVLYLAAAFLVFQWWSQLIPIAGPVLVSLICFSAAAVITAALPRVPRTMAK